MMKITVLLILGVLATRTVHADCFDQAAAVYGVPESLLRAIARVESDLRDLPPSKNNDGTWDIGIMRINSGWLPTLHRYGITVEALNDRCQNVMVGAWILASNKARYGMNWTAVGAYNVGCARLARRECEYRRNRYNWKVFCALQPEAHTACQHTLRGHNGQR